MRSLDQIRNTLQAQHVLLRKLVAELRSAASMAVADVPREDGLLRKLMEDAVERLRGALEVHLFDEERLLGPVLLRADAWGPQRLELMEAEHSHQRATLTLLRPEHIRSLELRPLARRAWELSAAILVDMEMEERDVLDPNVLRDDVICLDQSDS
jgi:hypothetical protein